MSLVNSSTTYDITVRFAANHEKHINYFNTSKPLYTDKEIKFLSENGSWITLYKKHIAVFAIKENIPDEPV